MARDIISEATAMPSLQTANSQPEQVPPPVAAPTPAPQHPARRDALAEAFPAWDLVPAVPFVRRVK
jgi:hypothetical protein